MWVWSRSWEDPLKEGRETFPVFLILLISLAILFVFCLFNKIIVSYITKCVVEPSKKWWLGYLKQLTRYIEKAMAPHFSTLAWKIPWMEEPGRLQSVESLSRTQLSDFTFHFHALEKEMATHSSVLAWRIPGMVEPDGLPSMGSHRVGHDWSDLAAA